MICRTWSRRVTLSTRDAEVFHALRYLECNADIAREPTAIAISIEPHRAGFRILQDGKVLGEQPSAQRVVESLHAELTNLTLADFPLAPLIHAASLRRAGRRILLVGQKGGGKTTLTLRLIREEYEIEGDENVFVTAEGVVPRPRGIRLKQSAAPLLPYLTDVLSAAPYYLDVSGQRTYNLDPRWAGASFWRIEHGAVDAVVLLRPNHGGDSSLRPLLPLALVREVMKQCGLPPTERAAAISAIAKIIGNARGFELSLGDLDGAVARIHRVCEEIA